MSVLIVIKPSGTKIRVREKTLLSDALNKAGLSPGLYCQGRGVCGKCAVEILEGKLPNYASGEKELLGRLGLSDRHRLACRHVAESDLCLRIPESALPGRISVVEFGPEVALPFEPTVKKYAVSAARSEDDVSETDNLFRRLGAASLRVPLDVLRKGPAVRKRSGDLLTAVVAEERDLIDIEPGDTTGRVFGLAFDVGTTTLAAAAVDLATGRVLSRNACLNGQTAYGADVISRINLVLEKPGRAETLRKAVLSDLAGLAETVMSSAGIAGTEVYAAGIAGNTVMSHLLLGLPVESLAVAPFASTFTSLPVLSPSEAGLRFLHPEAPVYIAPNIRSFIGGDTSAGLVASGFVRLKGPALYIDLGTNGEIVLKSGRDFAATSTAAGPAFEGMNISCGMLARTGAICRVEPEGDAFRYLTVDDAPARGLCGTGLIDMAALSLERGLMAPTGAIATAKKTLPLIRGLSLNQKDIRELQLAVGALRTGMRMMLDAHGLRSRELKAIFVAGAFGSRLSIDNSVALGLLPDIPASRFRFLGNASLSGAVALLLSVPARRAIEETARAVRHLSLASQPGFQDVYISSLKFKKWS
ncbi:MAG: DUF4445 domain-containing protein [Candidatus Aminicenantes bacterium]|nr:DUF4445 domain-containing protein [Candidatus Aminicenantes bacterium]